MMTACQHQHLVNSYDLFLCIYCEGTFDQQMNPILLRVGEKRAPKRKPRRHAADQDDD
jgi:hypothetical protein